MTLPEAADRQFTLRDAAVSWRDVDGEIVALDLESGVYFSLNGSGRLLWIALADRASAADLTDVLQDTFDIPKAQAASDAASFVDNLVKRNLVEAVA